MSHTRGRKTHGGTLAIPRARQRLHKLDKKRRRLEKDIERTRAAIEQASRSYVDFVVAMQREVAPLREQCIEVQDEIHALFAEIFRTRKFGQRSRRQIQRIYEELHAGGWLMFRDPGSPSGPEHPPEGPSEGAPEEPDLDWEQEHEPHAPRPPWRAYAGEPSRELRDVFLHLAGIFHPDRASDPDQEREHTEIMKKLNRAYREGDVASLLAIEREFLKRMAERPAGAPAGADDDIDARCARLESRIRLLEQQLENLQSALFDMQNDDLGQMIEHAETCRLPGLGPIESIVAGLSDTLAGLRKIRDFVRLFRDRKITIAAFVRGPDADDDDEGDDDDEIFEITMDLVVKELQSLMAREARMARKKKTPRKRKPR